MNYLIIGASSGIGKCIAEKLISQGHQVYSAQRTPINFSDSSKSVVFDALVDEFNPNFLPDQIDGLVYCPGSINLKPLHRLSSQDFYNDWQINFLGAIKVIQKTLPNLKLAKGSIVLFSSVAAQTGMPFHASISAAKAAIEGLTYSLAAELAPLVRVNAIAPSLTNTHLANKLLMDDIKKEAAAKRHPLQKYGNVNDMASAACYLLSSDASFITGQILKVDGGMSTIR
ncbi:MAG TPA: SDR family oxidoreductase [Bacteroidia bacterium]|nr:SDR family oxidoreductase [Bacteroidia bacterium]